MTRDDIFRLAQEAGMPKVYSFRSSATHWDFHPSLERFAALVAAAERERMIVEGWRHCAEGQRTTQYCGLLEDAVKAERKARKPTSAHDKVYSEVDLANAYQKGWDAAMLRRSLGGT
jgi:hypothetical protein